MSDDYKSRRPRGLSLRQHRYAEIYATGSVSGAAAACQAGYKPEGARQAAYRNNNRPEVRALIEELQDGYAAAAEVSRAEVIALLKKEALHCDSASTRVRALELLSKSIGMFTDRTQIEQVTIFADEPESLQDEIQAAIAEKDRQSRYDSD